MIDRLLQGEHVGRSDAVFPTGVTALPDIIDELLKHPDAKAVGFDSEKKYRSRSSISDAVLKKPKATGPWLWDSNDSGIFIDDRFPSGAGKIPLANSSKGFHLFAFPLSAISKFLGH